jgi:hypothetical protein
MDLVCRLAVCFPLPFGVESIKPGVFAVPHTLGYFLRLIDWQVLCLPCQTWSAKMRCKLPPAVVQGRELE